MPKPEDSIITFDLLVAGGGIGACLTAASAARRGARVALVEDRAYLGWEITARLRPWLLAAGTDQITPTLQAILCPEEERAEVDVADRDVPSCFRAELPLFRGTLKKQLSQLLADSGVTVLLMSHVAGVLTSGPSAVGVLLANKYGFQLLRARRTLDFTEGLRLARLVSGDSACAQSPGRRRFTIGFRGVALPAQRELVLSGDTAIVDNAVVLHAGRNRACNAYVEFAFDADPAAHNRLRPAVAVEHQARSLSIAVSRSLTADSPFFTAASVVDIARETTPEGPVMQPDTGSLPDGLCAHATHLPVDLSVADLLSLERTCSALAAEACARAATAGDAGSVRDWVIRSGSTVLSLPQCTVTEFDDPKLGSVLAQVRFDSAGVLPTIDSCAVLVAGGGTAGACAGIAAAEDGADVLVLESNADLGGTQTCGLVLGYYYGYCGGFTAALDERVKGLGSSMHNRDAQPRARIPKMLLYEQELFAQGGRYDTNTVVCGAVLEEDVVHGLVVANADGIGIVRAQVTIDATGDGDAAVFAGAASTYGDPRTGNVQDFSQWGLGTGGWLGRSLDLDVIDSRRMSELQRGLAIAHLKGRWFDFADMLTVRESRHITGEYTLSVVDVFECRQFDDAIAVASTDWDPHGTSSSWLGRLGFLPVHTEQMPLQIPLRSCIPEGLSGLLVTAKAISATADAACLCRMAADVQNLGYATGLAAALAAAAGGDPRSIDVRELQARLLELGVIPELPDPLKPSPRGTPEQRVARLAAGVPEALLDVALLPRSVALPLLEIAVEQPDADHLELAKGLAWFGNGTGVELLAEELQHLNALDDGRAYDDLHPTKPGNPRSGIIGALDDYWRVNQLLALIGIARGAKAVGAVQTTVQNAWSGGQPVRELNDYIKGRIDMQRSPHFDRLLCIAFCADRLAEERLTPALEALLDKEYVGGNISHDLAQAGPAYHNALAEVSLAAAAARCGSVRGGLRLVGFLADAHGILSGFAQRELTAVIGHDLGRSPEPWREHLADNAQLQPLAYVDQGPVF